jgi:RNA polymerase sigma factor (sigma-70 family)
LAGVSNLSLKTKKDHVKKISVRAKNSDNELELFKQVKSGNKIAQELIIQRYKNLVISVAYKYHNCFSSFDVDELIAEGNHGLLESISRFDPAKSAKFSTYAWFWIVKNIQDYVTSSLAIINIPQKVLSHIKKINSVINNELKRGEAPSLEKVSIKVDMDLENVRELLGNKKNITNPLSIDSYISQNDQETTYEEVISDKESSIRDLLEKSEEKIGLSTLFGRLSPVEQEVVKWRYGFVDNRNHTLKEVGDKLKLKPAKVKDIETTAIAKLKKMAANLDD